MRVPYVTNQNMERDPEGIGRVIPWR